MLEMFGYTHIEAKRGTNKNISNLLTKGLMLPSLLLQKALLKYAITDYFSVFQ